MASESHYAHCSYLDISLPLETVFPAYSLTPVLIHPWDAQNKPQLSSVCPVLTAQAAETGQVQAQTQDFSHLGKFPTLSKPQIFHLCKETEAPEVASVKPQLSTRQVVALHEAQWVLEQSS